MDEVPTDKIDLLSNRWVSRYPEIKTGPLQVWARMCRITDNFVAEATSVLAPFDLTYTEFQTLGALVLLEDAALPKQLASLSMLTSGGTANLLSRLERKQLLTRKQCEHDRRQVLVELTPKGRALFESALAAEGKVEYKMLEALDASERVQFINLLRKLSLHNGL